MAATIIETAKAKFYVHSDGFAIPTNLKKSFSNFMVRCAGALPSINELTIHLLSDTSFILKVAHPIPDTERCFPFIPEDVDGDVFHLDSPRLTKFKDLVITDFKHLEIVVEHLSSCNYTWMGAEYYVGYVEGSLCALINHTFKLHEEQSIYDDFAGDEMFSGELPIMGGHFPTIISQNRNKSWDLKVEHLSSRTHSSGEFVTHASNPPVGVACIGVWGAMKHSCIIYAMLRAVHELRYMFYEFDGDCHVGASRNFKITVNDEELTVKAFCVQNGWAIDINKPSNERG